MRVFYTQKLETILEKIELSNWRQRLQEPLTCNEQSLSDNWKFCALGEGMLEYDMQTCQEILLAKSSGFTMTKWALPF